MMQERFCQYLEHEKNFSYHTLAAYRNDLKQFTEFLHDTYQLDVPVEIRHFHIRSWMIHLLEKGNTARSINRKLSCLKTWFRFLKRNGEIEQNPILKVLPPKTGRRLPAVVRENHLARLFEEVDFGQDFKGQRNRLILDLLYCTGIRRSELINLKSEDIDFARNQIKVMGKGSKERLLPLAPHLMESIVQYLKIRSETFPDASGSHLILTSKGQPAYAGLVYNIVKKYLSLVTTTGQRSPHVLRHSFATHLSDHGADLKAIKDLLGHASLAATQVYTHNSIEKLKKVYEQAHPKAQKTDI